MENTDAKSPDEKNSVSRRTMLMRSWLGFAGLAVASSSQTGRCSPEERLTPSLTTDARRVELAVGSQKVVFTRQKVGYSLTTYVKESGQWLPKFDAARPLLEGSLFGSLPIEFTIVSNTPANKAIAFTGRHHNPEYEWTLHASATSGSPLLHFTLTSHLRNPLLLDSPQPVVAFWADSNGEEFIVNQGPDSIYGSAGIPHCFGFPSAYLWNKRIEAAVFFNMTPMRWMQRDGVARFYDIRIMARREGKHIGLGLHFKKLSGSRIPAGDMVIDLFLYQGYRQQKPAALEALDTMVRNFAPLHPSAEDVPRDQITGRMAAWSHVAAQTVTELMKPTTMAEIHSPWRDAPLELVPRQNAMLVHPATVQANGEQVASSWDFSTVNNHLTPWLLLARLKADPIALRTARQKIDALPRFYDARSRLIRHGTREPVHVGDLEMSWQNLFFHEETVRSASAAGPDNLNPAVVGRFLMATAGLRELARNVDYILPQWFDPYRKQPVVQNDDRRLGFVREPWQIGSYAHLMMRAFDITKETDYLDEARRAVDILMERMRYHIKNDVYERNYSDPNDFPITELFGNAYGIAAAHQIYNATGQGKYLRYSRYFLATLLRLTPWYNDETYPISRELRSAGLFYPHCGAHVVTPWETIEAHLMLVWVLKHDPDNPLRELLLKLANLNRINSFYFFPAIWTEPVRKHDGTNRSGPGSYFPIEAFYSLEGEGGHRGPTAAYMSSMGLWNHWMFDALAVSDDPMIMVLNLDTMDGYEAALQGIERHFIVCNPTTLSRKCMVQIEHVPDASYSVEIGAQHLNLPAERIRAGIPVVLDAGQHIRLTVRERNYKARLMQLQEQNDCQNAICHAYQRLQDRGSASSEEIRSFEEAMKQFRAGRYAHAESLIHAIAKKQSH